MLQLPVEIRRQEIPYSVWALIFYLVTPHILTITIFKTVSKMSKMLHILRLPLQQKKWSQYMVNKANYKIAYFSTNLKTFHKILNLLCFWGYYLTLWTIYLYIMPLISSKKLGNTSKVSLFHWELEWNAALI